MSATASRTRSASSSASVRPTSETEGALMNPIRNKKIVAGTVAALAVAGGGAAIGATQLSSPSQRSAAIVTDAAQQLGVQPSALSDALKKAEKKQVDAAVAS